MPFNVEDGPPSVTTQDFRVRNSFKNRVEREEQNCHNFLTLISIKYFFYFQVCFQFDEFTIMALNIQLYFVC